MGHILRLVALAVGLVSLTAGLWPVTVLSFAYLATSMALLRPKKSGVSRRSTHPRLRYAAAGSLLALAAVALVSGGALSPLLFSAAGAATLFWPQLRRRSLFSGVVPVENSVLLRSKYLPFIWYSLAEIKPGAESFPRALSSFTGTLLMLAGTGKAYSLVACSALGSREAESRLLTQLRQKLYGAYLLPLDSKSAADALRLKPQSTRVPRGDLTGSVSLAHGGLILDCLRGLVGGASTFEALPSSSANLPPRGAPVASPPLLWEVLDALGKQTKWPDPDPFSNLLDSMAATGGEPLSERLKSLSGTGDSVRTETLSGETVVLTRAQLRALVAIY